MLHWRIASSMASVSFLVLSMVGNLELHLIRYISDRVECLSDDGDGLGGEIGEEGYSHEEKDGSKSRRTHDVFQVLYHEESVLSAGLKMRLPMIGARNLAKVTDVHIMTIIMQKNHFQRFTLYACISCNPTIMIKQGSRKAGKPKLTAMSQ